MTFQTNRIYYLLSRDYRKSLLFDAVLLLFFVISYIQDPGEPLVELFSISLILVLYNLIRLGARPKEFVVERDRFT